MTSALRWLLSGMLILTLVLILAVTMILAAGLEMDLAPLRGTLERRATESVGRAVTITGDIKLIGGSRPLLTLRQVRIVPADTLARVGEMQMDKLQLRLELLSLLSSGSLIGAVALAGAEFSMVPTDREKSFSVHLERATLNLTNGGGFGLSATGSGADRPLSLTAQGNADGHPELGVETKFVLGATEVSASARMLLPATADNLSFRGVTARYSQNDTRARFDADALQLKDYEELIFGTVVVPEIRGRIVRGKDNRWRLRGDLGNLPMWLATTTADRNAGADATIRKGMVVKAREVSVRGPQTLTLVDPELKPTLEWALAFTELTIQDLDTASAIPLTRLSIAAQIDNHAELALTDTFASVAQNLSLSGNLQSLAMSRLSAVTRLYGYEIDAGQLDAKLAIELLRGQVYGHVAATIRGLSITSRDPLRLLTTERHLPVSLQTAVAMLTTADGTLELTMPLSGTLSSSGLELQLAVADPATRLLSSDLASLAPGPEATAMTEILGGSKNQLAPVWFTPGSATLDGQAKDHLAQLAVALRELPGITLTLCGRVTVADLVAQTDTGDDSGKSPRTLGQERAETIRGWLETRLGIAPVQLAVCQHGSDVDLDQSPRVELLH